MGNKVKVAAAVKAFGEEFKRKYTGDAQWLAKYKIGDESAFDSVLEVACSKAGVTVEEYEKTVLSDPELEAYQKELIGDAILANLQPGPDNPAARESAGAHKPVRQPRKWWQVWKSW